MQLQTRLQWTYRARRHDTVRHVSMRLRLRKLTSACPASQSEWAQQLSMQSTLTCPLICRRFYPFCSVIIRRRLLPEHCRIFYKEWTQVCSTDSSSIHAMALGHTQPPRVPIYSQTSLKCELHNLHTEEIQVKKVDITVFNQEMRSFRRLTHQVPNNRLLPYQDDHASNYNTAYIVQPTYEITLERRNISESSPPNHTQHNHFRG
jgi:hypothetical protein